MHPVSGKKTTFSGYLQQKLNSAGGVFTGPDPGLGQGGSVTLAPQ